MGEYFDISPLVSEKIAVFPGDQPFRRQVAMSFKKGDHLELSSVLTTVHLGAHADASNHYQADGQGIEARDIMTYLGACQVVRTNVGWNQRVSLADWAERKVAAPRILFATGTFPDPNAWRNDFASLSPDLVDWLADQGVRLIGIDTPSVDPAESKALECHQVLARRGLAVLEGLVLDQVPEGVYTLVALPLRWQGLDASPVRAILLKSTGNIHSF